MNSERKDPITVIIRLRPRPYQVEVTDSTPGIKNIIEIQSWYRLIDLRYHMQEAYVKAMKKAKKSQFNPTDINLSPSRFWFKDIFGAGMPVLVLKDHRNGQHQSCHFFEWKKGERTNLFHKTRNIVFVPKMWGDRVIETCSQGRDSND